MSIKQINYTKPPLPFQGNKRNFRKDFIEIVVDLNYKLKKYGVVNYMVTAGKVDKANQDEAEYIKIR